MAEPLPMTAAEFVERAEMIFGKNWRSPLGRLIDRSPRMIRFYAAAERPIPASIAEKMRHFTDMGETGVVIRDALRRSAPELPPYRSHLIAKEILAALTASGALGRATTSRYRGGAN